VLQIFHIHGFSVYCFLKLQLDEKTVTDWYSFLRAVCSDDLLRHPVVLGGPGRTVAIDESVIARRKPGNRQGRPVKEQWVFGAVDLTTKEFLIELVPRRDALTLIPVIQRMVLPGTTIWSDEWAAYNGLPGVGYPHQTVNHSQRFVDPVTGCQTNNIEARWNACKSKFKARFGVPRDSLPSYLDEYLWRSRRSKEAVFNDIIEAIKVKYPV
jgi:transposase-like protein